MLDGSLFISKDQRTQLLGRCRFRRTFSYAHYYLYALIGSLYTEQGIRYQYFRQEQVAETVVEGSGEDKVAIISIKGILSSESAEGLFIENPALLRS